MLASAVEARGFENALRSLLAGSRGQVLHVVGVGNPLRGDDGVGVEAVRLLRAKLGPRGNQRVVVHPPATRPEILIGKLASERQWILVLDAVEANMAPGSTVCARLGETRFGFFATHDLPLRLIPGVSGNLDRMAVAGVQPESVDVEEVISPTVRVAVSALVAGLLSVVGERH